MHRWLRCMRVCARVCVCVCAGKAHAAAASSHPDGHVYVWGSNQLGQLGTMPVDALTNPTGGKNQCEPVTSHVLVETRDVDRPVTLKELVPGIPVSLLQGMERTDKQVKVAHTYAHRDSQTYAD